MVHTGTEKWGDCRADSPAMDHYSHTRMWPVVSANDWCGRFLDKREPHEEKKTPIFHFDMSELVKKRKKK